MPALDCALLRPLLPAGIAAAEWLGEGDPTQLSDAEQHGVRRAAPKRAREFAAGRFCARHALTRFGVEAFALGMGRDRRPLWPPHLVGSITHTDGFCAAAVGERRRFRAIGIDAETIGGVTSDLWSRMFLPAEIAQLERLTGAEQARTATLMFSAKEAFYKCQYELSGQWLEFTDVAVEFSRDDYERGRVTVRPRHGTSTTVRFGFTPERVLTAAIAESAPA